MKKNEDAFGKVLVDHFNGARPVAILERDDGFVSADYGMALYFAPFNAWPAPERDAMQSVRGRVLDIGCGAGRAALHLKEQGHEVVAIDNSPLAVDVCKKRGVRDARVMSVTKVGASLGTFGTILMIGNNFGLLASPGRARWLLRRLRSLTTDDGRIIAGCRDPYLGATPEHRSYHTLNRRRGRLPGQLRIRVRYQQLASRWFDLLIVSKAEMKTILKGTGWHVATFLDSGDPNYVAIIEKDRA
jgi:SAM-dependent methyltransferase